MTIDPATLTLWQFADGLFPAGGYAHSFGLETYAQQGRVRDRASLEAFVVAHLEGSAGPCDAVAAASAARFAVAGDEAGILALDARLDAMKCVPEFRSASAQMGRQTLRIAAALDGDALLGALERAVDEGRTPGHHAVAFGAATGLAGVDPEHAAAAYLHSTCVLLIGAGLRLIQLGQLDGQRVLAAMRPRVARLAEAAAEAMPDDMWSFTPALEVAGIVHATLETRLFRS